MSKLLQLQDDWKDFATDRARERIKVNAELDDINNQQAELLRRKTRLQVEFNEKWRREKAKRKEAFDNAVMAELAKNRTGQDILQELGSNNTVWIYNLRKKIVDQFGNMNQVPKGGDQAPQPDPDIEGMMWEHHDHEGVHGILVDTTRNYIKKYGDSGTEFEGEWFVADMTNNFMAGNKKLYDATSTTELTKRVSMLTQLLDGEYAGHFKLSPNPYRH